MSKKLDVEILGLKSLDLLCCDSIPRLVEKLAAFGFIPDLTGGAQDSRWRSQAASLNIHGKLPMEHENFLSKVPAATRVFKLNFHVRDLTPIQEVATRCHRPQRMLDPLPHEDGRRLQILAIADTIFEFSERGPPLTVDTSRTEGLIQCIDHVAYNVAHGTSEPWFQFLEALGFTHVDTIDVKRQGQGMQGRIYKLSGAAFGVTIIEPEASHSQSQIQRFLDDHQGPGVQHIAFLSSDIFKQLDRLKSQGIVMVPIPGRYFDIVKQFSPLFSKDWDRIKGYEVAVDGDANGMILQKFSEAITGQLFFELVERQNYEGFGIRNFHALFDAVAEAEGGLA